MITPAGARSRMLVVDGLDIHVLEGGRVDAPALVLLHSCEFGAAAEFSFEYNFAALASHYRVIAPDMLGYGLSDKVYDFGRGPTALRLQVLASLLRGLGVEEADFIGNSCGASFLLQWMADAGPRFRDVLPVRRMVLVSPSAIGTPGPGRAALNAYAGEREQMRDILAALFHDPCFPADEAYLDRRQESAMRPGHWETVAAARFRRPGRAGSGFQPPSSRKCVAPVLFITGANDKVVAEPDGAIANVGDTPCARFEVFPRSGHCSQIEHPDRFNALALAYLSGEV